MQSWVDNARGISGRDAVIMKCDFHAKASSPGGSTPIYGLYRYVPRNRVWFLRFSVLTQGIFFYPFVTVFLVWFLDRVAKLYYLIMECENARLIGCHFTGLGLKKGIRVRFAAHP